MLLQIAAGGVKIGERGLRFYEVELHQAADCVVNVDQQRAGGAALLKPAMIAAVNLYKFANAGATISWLLDPWRTHFPGDSKSRSNHQLTHGLFGQHNVMGLGQLLAGERGTKVGIVIADDAQSKLSKVRRRFAKASGPDSL